MTRYEFQSINRELEGLRRALDAISGYDMRICERVLRRRIETLEHLRDEILIQNCGVAPC